MKKEELQKLGLHEININASYKNYKGSGIDSKAKVCILAKQSIQQDNGVFSHISYTVEGDEIDAASINLMDTARKIHAILKEQTNDTE